MDTKRNKLYSSTPARGAVNIKKVFSEKESVSEVGSPEKENSLPSVIRRESVLSMVIDAIKAIGLPKKGASYPAIKKWIVANKDADPKRLASSLKVAVKKGIDRKLIMRPKNYETMVGATGYFVLPKSPPKKVVKKTVTKATKISNETVTIASKSKKVTATKTNEKAAKKAQAPSQAKNTVTKTAKKSPKKAESKTNHTKASSKAPAKEKVETKPTEKAPPKAKAKKKPAAKAPLKEVKDSVSEPTDGEIVDVTPTTSKLIKNKAGKKEALIFSDDDDDEDVANAAASKEAAKRKGNAKAAAKNNVTKKAEKSKPVKVEDVKVKKEKVKETKKAKNPDETSNKQLNGKQKAAKAPKNKKFVSNMEMDREEVSDSEMTLKKHRLKVLKSFSSDTELEVSKREEKKSKRVVRGKKNISQA